MEAEQLIFAIIAFALFIYMFYKMIKDNETSYVILIIMQAFGIVLNFIEIISKVQLNLILSIIKYLLAVLLPIVIIILEKNKISVPIGEKFLPNEWKLSIIYAKKIGFPVVIKPVFGSHGDNIYMDIENENELKDIVQNIYVKKLKTSFIIEKQFEGKEYRVFLTKEGNYAVLHREPAHVIGDGEHTILKLIEIENEKRKKRINCLCPIATDEITKSYMKKNNISMEYKPAKNEKVYLRHNSNVAKGGLCIDYTDKIHKSVLENCKKILETFSGLSYVGIDYMSKNIEKNQTPDMYNIVEVNTVPGIHMHMKPSEGKPRNVAKYMVDMIFPETKEQKNDKT